MCRTPEAKPTRGVDSNPPNRFEQLHLEPAENWYDPEERPLRTRFYRDASQTIINYNDSPDIPFEASINPYRGCEHGCVYCYARPFHEYLGFSSGLDFESRIMVKEDAPELLRKELSSRKWKPQVLAMSGVTDCYQPVERKLKLTRRCLEVLAEFRNPVGIVTKNQLVTRDIDLLAELARHDAAGVFISLTTLDADLRRLLEPRTAPPAARLRTIQELSSAGIPTGVMIAPIIPGLTDHEIPKLLQAAFEAGARAAGSVVLRLPHSVAPLFENWLERHYPNSKEKVLNRLKELRGGKVYDATFGARMTGQGPEAERIAQLFEVGCRKVGFNKGGAVLSTAAFRRPEGNQMHLL